MNIENLNCPQCGAPVSIQSGQNLAVCVYCDSNLRIQSEPAAKTAATRIPEISAGVIDELKQLLVMGKNVEAVNFYAKKTGSTDYEAGLAIQGIKKSIGYKPPMNTSGLLRLLALLLLSAGGLLAGLALLTTGRPGTGILIIMVAVLFTGMNWLAFGENFKATLLLRQGIPARATILKVWPVKSITGAPGVEAQLLRLLLEIQPAAQSAYRAEANCIVSQQSRHKFEAGALLQVRFDRQDQKHVVVSGPASSNA